MQNTNKSSTLLNWCINKLPIELHLPGYNYCGPGTRLHYRLDRGYKGVNLLDEYCKEHDIAYLKSSLSERHKADINLMKMARMRISAPDAKLGEKLAAHIVNKAMLVKIKSGAGIKRTNKNKLKKASSGSRVKKHLKHIIAHTKQHLSKIKPVCKKIAIESAMAAARELAKDSSVKIPRIIPIPKTGGFLPIIPIFAGLSAAGSLTGGAVAIAKIINEYKSARSQLEELKRHNEKMEALCIGKGLHLKAHKDGYGILVSDKKN